MSSAVEEAKTAVPDSETVRRGGGLLMWTLRILSFVIFIAAWEWYGRRPDSFTVAPFTDVMQALYDGFASGEFTEALAGTFLAMITGYGIAVVLGVGIGLWIGVSSYARNTIEPLVNAGYATPVSLLIPVLGIYFGLGFQGRVTLVVLWCIFEIIVNTSAGVRDVSPALIETGRAFNASRRNLYRKVILPAAAPHIMLGLRLGVAKAIRGAITAELLLAAANFGKLMLAAGSTFNIPKLLAGILLTVLMGVALMAIATRIEKRVMQYRS